MSMRSHVQSFNPFTTIGRSSSQEGHTGSCHCTEGLNSIPTKTSPVKIGKAMAEFLCGYQQHFTAYLAKKDEKS